MKVAKSWKLDAGAAQHVVTHTTGMTRREAMLDLLRVGGVAAGVAGLPFG